MSRKSFAIIGGWYLIESKAKMNHIQNSIVNLNL